MKQAHGTSSGSGRAGGHLRRGRHRGLIGAPEERDSRRAEGPRPRGAAPPAGPPRCPPTGNLLGGTGGPYLIKRDWALLLDKNCAENVKLAPEVSKEEEVPAARRGGGS